MAGQVVTGDLITATWLNEVERRKPTSASVAASQTTTSTSYTDLATTGPAVTVTTGTSALVSISAYLDNNSAGQNSYMSFGVTGATTSAAVEARGLSFTGTGQGLTGSRVFLMTGLTAGSNTFTMKYKVQGGTGTFANREIIVIPQD